jgi:plasmid maintenance system antidote protein VapI
MKFFGSQQKLSKIANVSQQMLNDCLNGRKNFSAPNADRMAFITETDIRLWLKGGKPEDRQAAFDKWALENQ